MNKRDRSIANMRSEAQRIYYQRQEIKRLQEENQKLKEQLENMQEMQCTFLGTGCKRKMEELEKSLKDMYHINIDNDKELDKLKKQQKEFVEWLEYYLKENGYTYSPQSFAKTTLTVVGATLQVVLRHYKEITGDEDGMDY